MAIDAGYATVADLKDHLGDPRPGETDPQMERAVESASRIIDAWTGRRFWLDVDSDDNPLSSSRLYPWRYGTLYVDDFTSLVSVTPEASRGVLGDPYLSTAYRPGPLNAPVMGEPYNWIEGDFWAIGGTWKSAWRNELSFWVSVEAVWGWPSVPKAITQACLLMAARILKRRESVTATYGFDDLAMRLSSTDPDVTMLLSPYKWISVG